MKDENGHEIRPLREGVGIYRVYYWRQINQSLVSCPFEEATEVEIQIPTRIHYQEVRFAWPKHSYLASKICNMLHQAHELGIENGKAQVRQVLGIFR
jgi:hypothetical protein